MDFVVLVVRVAAAAAAAAKAQVDNLHWNKYKQL